MALVFCFNIFFVNCMTTYIIEINISNTVYDLLYQTIFAWTDIYTHMYDM